jgi:hypothetical protein
MSERAKFALAIAGILAGLVALWFATGAFLALREWR